MRASSEDGARSARHEGTIIMTHRNPAIAACLIALLALAGLTAQLRAQTVPPTRAQTQGIATTEEMSEQRAREALSAGRGEGRSLPVFGANLFTGSFAASRATEQASYILQRGDKVFVRVYGAQNVEAVEEIDGRGNLFLPGVGPIELAGRKAGDLQPLIAQMVSTTYTDNVKVYAALISPGSIGVYVTGHVTRPGRYLGSPLDDVLFFLDQAGGIDGGRGSFRAVQVTRDNRVVERFDLYNFLLAGRLPKVPLKDGDVIFVEARGPVVQVEGQVRASYSFEMDASSAVGSAVIALARPDPAVTNVAVQGVRGGVPSAQYYSLAEFANAMVENGDSITFRADAIGDSITVAIEANLAAPSLYVVPRDVRLSELLAAIPIDGSSVDPSSVHIRRRSVAIQQKAALEESLTRLEREVLGASATTTEEAHLQTAQADLLGRFIARAREAQPEGIVSVFTSGRLTDIQLEDGDVIVIPDQTEVVMVAGEVVAPGAFAAHKGVEARDYIERAGGFTRAADEDDVVVRRRDGTSVQVSPGYVPDAGDQILVLPEVSTGSYVLAKDIAQILFQIALTTAAVLSL